MKKTLGVTSILVTLAVATLLAVYGHVQTNATDGTNDPDPWNFTYDSSVTAGNTLVFGWVVFGDAAVAVGCGTPTTNNGAGDTFETVSNINFGTSLRLCVGVVCEANGGSTTITVTHGTALAVGDVFNGSEFSGIASTSCIEDADTESESGVTTTTTPALDTAGAALIYSAIATNRDPDAIGEDAMRWEGTNNFTAAAADKRVSGAGSHTMQWDLDISGVTLTVSYALTESAAAGACPTCAIINGLRSGGAHAALVQSKTVTRGR